MSKLFGSKPEQPKVARMPVPDDAASRDAALRQRQAIANRSGRRSTIMTRGGGEAGTTAFKNSLLGQAG